MKKIILSLAFSIITGFHFLQAQSTSPAPYCVADFDDANGDVPDAIDSVSFGTLLNASNAQCPFPHYIFYNNLPVPNFIMGHTYTLGLTFDVHGGAGYGVWIDYNHDTIFQASEKVSGTSATNFLNLSSYPAHTPVTQTITIPATALTGPTRMRVRIVEDDTYTGTYGASILACNTGTTSTDVMDWGETEDYTIDIISSQVDGIRELSVLNKFSVYPNPASGLLRIDQTIPGDLTYKIIDLTGEVIQAGKLNTLERQIPLAPFSEGIYFLQLFNGNGSLGQQKFIKASE